MSQERGIILSFFVTAILGIWLLFKKNKATIFMMIGSFGLAVMIGSGAIKLLLKRFSSWSSLDAILENQIIRVDAWKAAIDMIQDHPLFGVGPGMWWEHIPAYTYRTMFWRVGDHYRVWWISDAHNVYLKIGSEAGLLSLIAFLMLCGMTFVTAFKILKKSQSPKIYILTASSLWALSAISLAFFSGGNLTYLKGFIYHSFFWVPIALIRSLENIRMHSNPILNMAGGKDQDPSFD